MRLGSKSSKPRRPRRNNNANMFERTRCRFCTNKEKIVDYKDIEQIQKLCTSQGKLYSRKRSGNCAHHQRQAKQAVKRARVLALLPYTARHKL